MKKTQKILLFILALTLITSSIVGCGKKPDENTITIGGKKYTEQVLLVEILEQLLTDRTDINVINRGDLGSTDILHQGMKDKDIDMYVEYTGTAYAVIMKGELDTMDPQIIYERVKDYYEEELDMSWLTPFGFNNTYALIVREEMAEELGLEKISDIIEHALDMTLTSSFEFLEREDGIDNFNKEYDLTWRDSMGMDPGLMYMAIKEEQLEAIIGFATDGRIPGYKLKVLEDDKLFFPPYFGAVVINNDALERFPEIADVIDELVPYLTMEKMAELNAQVDIDQELESKVAKDFLIESGLIEE